MIARLTIAAAALTLPLALSAQVSAYTSAPPLPPPARLVVPPVASVALPNGLQLRVVEQHELPLVQITLAVMGGSRLDGATAGLASFMASMLDDGAGSRDALALQGELAYLGASLSTSADWDRVVVSLKVPVRSIVQALDLMADVALRPTFRSAEIRRQRDLRLTSLLQLRDQPNAIAGLAFNQVLFPADHPYRRNAQGDSTSVAAFDSIKVREFYSRVMQPERATFYVVGDVNEAQVHSLLEPRFGGWRPAAAAVPIPASAPTVARLSTSRVVVVDKPEAAQSVIMIGWPGVDRRTPDYAALTVMNTLLGASFTSRLNMNLRETKGYSYGASSGFAFRQVPGPFSAQSAVRTNVTDSSLVEFFKELRGVRDAPVPADELARAKAYIEGNLLGALESTTQVAGQLATLALYGLALDEMTRFATQVRAVTSADVQRVARQYLTPDQALVVVVGDLAKVRAPIEALKLGPITQLEVKVVAP